MGARDSTGGPGPNQLYALGRQQFDQRSFAAARTALDDLLQRFPTSDVAPDALYYVGESFASERNTAAADSVYAAVVTRYPDAPRLRSFVARDDPAPLQHVDEAARPGVADP